MEIKQCRGVDLEIAEDHVMHMNECLKEAGAKEVVEIEPGKMPVRSWQELLTMFLLSILFLFLSKSYFYFFYQYIFQCFGKCVFSKKGLVSLI